MKADEKVKKILVRSLREHLTLFFISAENLLNDIEDAKTVEEVMMYKRDLLSKWVYEIPLQSRHCYFCILKILLSKNSNFSNFSCWESCKYAKHHGVCDSQADSDYSQIKKKIKILLAGIDDYYKGETYEEEEKEADQ